MGCDPDYRYATVNSAANAWLLRKEDLAALLLFCEKRDWRDELRHVAFTDFSIAATDGSRLFHVVQKGRVPHDVERFVVVHRRALERARRSMTNKRERLMVPLDGNRGLSVLEWEKEVGEGYRFDAPAARMMLPPTVEHSAKENGWLWPSRIGVLIDKGGESDYGASQLSPTLVSETMKAFKSMGFRTVEVKIGRENSGAIFRSSAPTDHPLEVTAVVMGMLRV